MIRPYVLDLPKGRAWTSFPPFLLEIHTGNLSKISLVVGTRRPHRSHRWGEQSKPSLVPSWVVLPWLLISSSAQGLGILQAPGEMGWQVTG